MTAPRALLSAMDRPREAAGRTGRRWLIVSAGLILAGLPIAAMLRPAQPAVERSSLVIDTVRRGPFVHEISASGSLVAEQARLIAAPAAGRVEAIHVEPGDRLRPGAAVLQLVNRDTLRQLLEVEQQVAAAEAELADLEATLQAGSLERESALRRTEFEMHDASRQAEASMELSREGLMSSLEATRHREAAVELAARLVSERSRHEALLRSADAQLAAERNRLARLRALHDFHRGVVDSLRIEAPSETTVRDIDVQEGEWVSEGQRIVRLVEPGRLKAVLLVPEASAHEIRVGQPVTLSARGAALLGEVSRIAAAVDEGTLAVDVRLDGELPPSARPDLSVEGRIEVSRLPDALSIGRTVHATAGAAGSLFKIDPDDATERKASIAYGPASVDRIVITSGASAGDRFILAGLDAHAGDVIRLE